MTICARRKDGSPVRVGDGVFVRYENGATAFGWVRSITGARRFQSLRGRVHQVYIIGCKDGMIRPALAAHIKKVNVTNNRKRRNFK